MSIIKLDGHTNIPKSILDGHTKGRYVDNKTRWTHKIFNMPKSIIDGHTKGRYVDNKTRWTQKRAICP